MICMLMQLMILMVRFPLSTCTLVCLVLNRSILLLLLVVFLYLHVDDCYLLLLKLARSVLILQMPKFMLLATEMVFMMFQGGGLFCSRRLRTQLAFEI